MTDKAIDLHLPDEDHCDRYIGTCREPDCLQWWLLINRLPATEKMLAHRMGVSPSLYADYRGKRVRCTMASRFGDIGITFDLKRECGYTKRVAVKELSNFSPTPESEVTK